MQGGSVELVRTGGTAGNTYTTGGNTNNYTTGGNTYTTGGNSTVVRDGGQGYTTSYRAGDRENVHNPFTR